MRVYLVQHGEAVSELMFVGHHPFMDRLAGLLVGGNPEGAVVQFSKAASSAWSAIPGPGHGRWYGA